MEESMRHLQARKCFEGGKGSKICAPFARDVSIFREVNPEAIAETAFKRGHPLAGGGVGLVEQEHVAEEIKMRALEELTPPSYCERQSMQRGRFLTTMPLANPKGVKTLCELCFQPARLVCRMCRLTFYCTREHQQEDWLHADLCVKLAILRGKTRYSSSSIERNQSLAQRSIITCSLLDEIFCNALESLYEGKNEMALAQFRMCLPIFPKTYGLTSCEGVTLLAFLSETFLIMGMNTLARESLAMAVVKAKKLETRKPDLDLTYTKSFLFKAQGRLDLAEKLYQDAIFHFAECVYHAAEVFGPDQVRVCAGYYYLGWSFVRIERTQEGLLMLAFCAHVWMAHVARIFRKSVPEDDIVEHKVIFAEQNPVGSTMVRFLNLEAYSQLRGIESVFRELGESSHGALAKTAVTLGMLDSFRGNHKSSLRMAERALMLERSGGPAGGRGNKDPEVRRLATELKQRSTRALSDTRRNRQSPETCLSGECQ